MVKKQVIIMRGIKILFVLVLSLLSGCVTPSSAPKTQAKKGVLDDVLTFRDLQQVDLDKDGIKEIVAIYATGINSSGVKVIKFHNDIGDVIFGRIFNTTDVKFAMNDNVPTLIVERTVQARGCAGSRLKSIYHWDGKAFTPAGNNKE